MKKSLLKLLGTLTLLVIIVAVIARIFSGTETLIDYADKNPEIAYATPIKTTSPQDGKETSPYPELSPKPAAMPTATPVTAYADREIYQPDFYKEPLSEALIASITGISYPISPEEAEILVGLPDAVQAVNIVNDMDSLAISYDDLCYLSVLHYDFNGEIQTGELICNRAVADDLLEIFYELYVNEYQIAKIRLIEEYSGDDTLSILDNNTSCFNYRMVDGSSNLSKHALGLAIDINPFYNPYVVYRNDGSTYISPEGSEKYVDRSHDFPYKIDENDLCYKLFKEHGFIWGGNWNSLKDYQHFQKTLD